jgi:hypothetical protein
MREASSSAFLRVLPPLMKAPNDARGELATTPSPNPFNALLQSQDPQFNSHQVGQLISAGPPALVVARCQSGGPTPALRRSQMTHEIPVCIGDVALCRRTPFRCSAFRRLGKIAAQSISMDAGRERVQSPSSGLYKPDGSMYLQLTTGAASNAGCHTTLHSSLGTKAGTQADMHRFNRCTIYHTGFLPTEMPLPRQVALASNLADILCYASARL